MKQKRTKTTEIYKLGQTLGLNTNDIKVILRHESSTKEQMVFAIGPPSYGGGYYGTISINELSQ
ncbi:MAG: hypothetical protein NTZ75_06925 [Euryarchaeota archaeon]|nr:hypothetical protein [Euryarchaeota archaeon]